NRPPPASAGERGRCAPDTPPNPTRRHTPPNRLEYPSSDSNVNNPGWRGRRRGGRGDLRQAVHLHVAARLGKSADRVDRSAARAAHAVAAVVQVLGRALGGLPRSAGG